MFSLFEEFLAASVRATRALTFCAGVCRLVGAVPAEPVTKVSEIARLESTHPKMSFTCRFRRAFFTIINRVLLIAVGE